MAVLVNINAVNTEVVQVRRICLATEALLICLTMDRDTENHSSLHRAVQYNSTSAPTCPCRWSVCIADASHSSAPRAASTSWWYTDVPYASARRNTNISSATTCRIPPSILHSPATTAIWQSVSWWPDSWARVVPATTTVGGGCSGARTVQECAVGCKHPSCCFAESAR